MLMETTKESSGIQGGISTEWIFIRVALNRWLPLCKKTRTLDNKGNYGNDRKGRHDPWCCPTRRAHC
jgi:chorismate synthase